MIGPIENLRQETGSDHYSRATPRDIADYLESLRWIEQSLFQWASIIESSEDAIIGKDLDGIITTWNRGAEKIYGYSSNEMIGSSVLKIFPPNQKKELQGILGRIKKGQQIQHYETRRVRKDGRIIDVSVTISPIKDISGNIIGASVIARDITEQKRINNERLSLAAIVDSTEEAIISQTLDGSITSWNKGAERLCGYTAKEMIGESFSTLFPAKQKGEVARLLRNIKAGKKVADHEISLQKKSGRKLQVSMTLSPVCDDTGELIGASVIARDISRRHEKEQIREQEMTAKDEFISLASHQLRTPATGTKQYIGMVLEGYAGDVPEEMIKFLEHAYESNERQLTLINELLRIAKTDAGKIVLRKEKFNLSELVEDVVLELKGSSTKRQQELVHKSKPKNLQVVADKENLRMVLENLIDNASKYTPAGKTITVTLGRENGGVCIAVKDQGVGIDKADTEKLFDKFSRIKNPLSAAAGGTGLGLYWADKIVKMHGGTIEVTSEISKGSTFTVKLPA
ncbi:MAG TPA: PAS domain S-box protein [Candidatus Limnocylindrales bacterium]|nr:PAS domain S-box protein [Candidatus Limnocylindrales bacterium]